MDMEDFLNLGLFIDDEEVEIISIGRSGRRL